jgi:hypothetical protein
VLHPSLIAILMEGGLLGEENGFNILSLIPKLRSKSAPGQFANRPGCISTPLKSHITCFSRLITLSRDMHIGTGHIVFGKLGTSCLMEAWRNCRIENISDNLTGVDMIEYLEQLVLSSRSQSMRHQRQSPVNRSRCAGKEFHPPYCLVESLASFGGGRSRDHCLESLNLANRSQ